MATATFEKVEASTPSAENTGSLQLDSRLLILLDIKRLLTESDTEGSASLSDGA